jgi:hypothetical protein
LFALGGEHEVRGLMPSSFFGCTILHHNTRNCTFNFWS